MITPGTGVLRDIPNLVNLFNSLLISHPLAIPGGSHFNAVIQKIGIVST